VGQLCDYAPQSQPVATFANVLRDAEKSRASVQSKFQLARWVLCREAYNQGSNPFQDFALLIDLRNSLLHLKPWPNVVQKLKAKGLIQKGLEELNSIIGGWTLLIQTQEIAVWACRSAILFIAEFLDAVSQDISVRTALPTKNDYFGSALWLLSL
jgi:hypothetical protein